MLCFLYSRIFSMFYLYLAVAFCTAVFKSPINQGGGYVSFHVMFPKSYTLLKVFVNFLLWYTFCLIYFPYIFVHYTMIFYYCISYHSGERLKIYQ